MNFLLVLLCIVSTSIFANDNFKIDLEYSYDFLIQSKNYEAIFDNEDGTISIEKPKFSNPKGTGSLPLSSSSNFNGVCDLFGFDEYVSNSALYLAGDSELVRINSHASFERFDDKNYYAINYISCKSKTNKTKVISTNYSQKIVNDDGSTTITYPAFTFNGTDYPVSSSSTFNGVCKLYGLSSYVSNSAKYYSEKSTKRRIRVSSNSRFDQYDGSRHYAIKSMLCN